MKFYQTKVQGDNTILRGLSGNLHQEWEVELRRETSVIRSISPTMRI